MAVARAHVKPKPPAAGPLQLAPHALLAVFPRLTADDFAALRSDIASYGVREPVWTWRGWLIDGRERVKACRELGIACPAQEWSGSESGLAAFIVGLNLYRRHLSESQRAMIAAKLANGRAGDNQYRLLNRGVQENAVVVPIGTTSLDQATSKPAAAGLLNVSLRSVNRAAAVIAHGIPELVAAVESDRLAVSAAESISFLPPEKQRAALQESAELSQRSLSTSPRLRDDPDKYIRRVKGGRYQARPFDLGVRYDLGLFATMHEARTAIREFWWGQRDSLPRFVKCVHTKAGQRYRAVITHVIGEFATREEAADAAERWIRATFTAEGAKRLLSRSDTSKRARKPA
jgi:hypothetical protein